MIIELVHSVNCLPEEGKTVIGLYKTDYLPYFFRLCYLNGKFICEDSEGRFWNLDVPDNNLYWANIPDEIIGE